MDVQQIVMWVLAIVGAASLLVQAFVKIADVTPNTKDDKIAAKLTKWVGVIVYALDRVAMNLPSSKARKCEDGSCDEDHRST